MAAKGIVGQKLKKAPPFCLRRLARQTATRLVNVFFPQPPPPPDPPDIAALKRQLRTMPWFHSIDLGNGVVTPGQEPTKYKLRRLGIPEDLTGKSVLDIGA